MGGGRGIPQFSWCVESSYLCYIGPHTSLGTLGQIWHTFALNHNIFVTFAKFQNPTTTLYGRLSRGQRRKREINNAYYIYNGQIVGSVQCLVIPKLISNVKSKEAINSTEFELLSHPKFKNSFFFYFFPDGCQKLNDAPRIVCFYLLIRMEIK